MDLVEHYRRLLSVAQWLDMGLNWTVVQRPDRPVGPEDVAEVVGWSGWEIREREVEDGLLFDDSGPSTMLLDTDGGVFSAHEHAPLERLSAGGRVWHVEWDVNGRAWMLYAADGHIRLWMHNLDPREVHGPDPHALDHLVHLLPDPFTIASRAGALALVTMDSGAHLDPEWFELPQREIHPLV